MCIEETYEMDIISVNKTMTKESKQTETKRFIFVEPFENFSSTFRERKN